MTNDSVQNLNSSSNVEHSIHHIQIESHDSDKVSCPLCTQEVCFENFDVCNLVDSPYICTDGRAIGGCSAKPWEIDEFVCKKCCLLTADCANVGENIS